MGYTFNPTPAEASILQQVASRESSGNYLAQNPKTSASGAYQFVNDTWQMASAATGVPYYPTAASAPASVQDINALWLLRYAGGDPNASVAWAASGPYDTSSGTASGALVDVSGSAASTSTADLMSQINASALSMGIDLTSPTTDIVVALAVAVGAYLVLS